MRTAEDIVRMEVHYCVSHLVHTLAAGFGCIEPAHMLDLPRFQGAVDENAKALAALTEQAFELAAPIDDWEESAREAGWTKKTYGEAVKWWNPSDDDGSRYCDTESSLRALCEDHDLDPYQLEVFEHWIFSDWLAGKLEAKGEKVDRDFAGMTVWARTTTGQAISIDYVIEQIVSELSSA